VVFIYVMCGDASGQNNLVCLYTASENARKRVRITPNHALDRDVLAF